MNFSPNLLPPSLLDLTYARLSRSSSARLNAFPSRVGSARPLVRPMGQLAVQQVPREDHILQNPMNGVQHVQKTPIPSWVYGTVATARLKARVDELVSYSVTEDVPKMETETYNEEDLVNIFTDILAHGESPESNPEVQQGIPKASEHSILSAVADRLMMDSNTSPQLPSGTQDLASRLRARQLPGSVQKEQVDSVHEDTKIAKTLRGRILLRLEEITKNVRPAGSTGIVSTSVENAPKLDTPNLQTPPVLSIGILSESEWKALLRSFVIEAEYEYADRVVSLARRLDSHVSVKIIDDILSMFVENGQVTEVEAIITKFLQGRPTEAQRDLHIKAYLNSKAPHEGTVTALSVLHNYEALALPVPMKSYTRVIISLFHSNTAVLQAQAWDLFYHMRYVSHKDPDIRLYSIMIRACVTGPSHASIFTEPEKALDLWTEMTVDKKLKPDLGAYNAIILVCARSKGFHQEAFRLTKEMMDSHRDAFGRPLMKPDRFTFRALLTAAKLMKDLGRARWILVEMIRSSQESPLEDAWPDNMALLHLFNCYAAYQPPFQRERTAIIDESTPTPLPLNNVDPRDLEKPAEPRKFLLALPPQTHAEVIAEATTLLERVLRDVNAEASTEPTPHPQPFSRVTLDSKLLNGYLGVIYAHGSLQDANKAITELSANTGVEPDIQTYIGLLERCGHPGHGEFDLAEEIGRSVWERLRALLEQDMPHDSLWACLVEKSYSSMIRLLSRNWRIDEALSLVREFHSKYPPSHVSIPAERIDSLGSSRVQLFAPKPLVRMTTATEVVDDRVPPLLLFGYIGFLHKKLAAASRLEDLAYLKYVCKSYEGALRRRRDRSLKMKRGV